MKKIVLSSLLLALVCLSCNQKIKEDENPKAVVEEAKAEEVAVVEEITEVSDAVKASVSTEAIINSYLKIKNALANDNSDEAATLAADFSKAVEATKADKIAAELKDKYSKTTEEAKKQAALIVSNSGKIDQQRKSFAVLSQKITSLIATFGTNKKLFQDYCPMYDEGKSGYWISEMKAIRNPYYGSEMLECGGMIKEIK